MQFSSLCAVALSVSSDEFITFIYMYFFHACIMCQGGARRVCEAGPWACWEWTESLREVRPCCDPRGSGSRGKVTCEGCRALRDDKHHSRQISNVRRVLIQQPGEGRSRQCRLRTRTLIFCSQSQLAGRLYLKPE